MHRVFMILAGVVAIWLQVETNAQGSVPAFVTTNDRPLLSRWLSANPTWRLATERDCWFWNWNSQQKTRSDCREGLDNIRKTQTKDYQPYYLSADLNGDGLRDIAVFVISGINNDQGQLLIFNRPIPPTGAPVPAFSLPTSEKNVSSWTFGHFAMHYGPPRPEPYRLLIGEWEAEGAIIEPVGTTYRVRY